MFVVMVRREVLVGLLLGVVGLVGRGYAAGPVEKFHEAYFLETAKGDCAAASKLYAEVSEDARADAQVRSDAAARLAGCREELASLDFASLMPAESLAYFELKNPGDRLARLLSQLGLLSGGQVAPKGDGPRVAISPSLLKELLGIRGLAVAITGFDPMAQAPKGVAIMHPGDLEVIRGLIETGLPAASAPVEPVAGFPTYRVEDQVFVTLTSRLVIASTDRPQIEAVIRRLNGKGKGSLAGNEAFASAIGGRDDALLLFTVNVKPVMPIAKGLLTLSGDTAQQFAMADSLLDLSHLSAIAGKWSVSEAGLEMDLTLQLDADHHNLAFNLLRAPGVNKETLKAIPEGVALFLVAGFNDAAPCRLSDSAKSSPPIVTLLDYGREFFANMTSVAVFVLPPDSPGDAAKPTAGTSSSGPPIPDIGLIITVNDPAKSQALWVQTLGLASLATGASGIEGATIEVEGSQVRTFAFSQGPTVHFTTAGNDVLIASSRAAIARSIQAKKTGKSVLTDAALAPAIARLNENTTKLAAVHAARAVRVGKQFMPPKDFEEIAPFVGVLTDTAASVSIEHSNTLLRFSAQLTGLPDVSGVVAQVLAGQKREEQSREELARLLKKEKWDEALRAVDANFADKPSGDLLRKKFDVLATGKKDRDAALRVGREILESAGNDAKALNNFAWELLTEEKYALQFNELALKLSERSNELTGHQSWVFLDTLALAKFETGDIEAAIELEKKAISLSGDKNRPDLRNALSRFEAARDKSRAASNKSGTD